MKTRRAAAEQCGLREATPVISEAVKMTLAGRGARRLLASEAAAAHHGLMPRARSAGGAP